MLEWRPPPPIHCCSKPSHNCVVARCTPVSWRKEREWSRRRSTHDRLDVLVVSTHDGHRDGDLYGDDDDHRHVLRFLVYVVSACYRVGRHEATRYASLKYEHKGLEDFLSHFSLFSISQHPPRHLRTRSLRLLAFGRVVRGTMPSDDDAITTGWRSCPVRPAPSVNMPLRATPSPCNRKRSTANPHRLQCRRSPPRSHPMTFSRRLWLLRTRLALNGHVSRSPLPRVAQDAVNINQPSPPAYDTHAHPPTDKTGVPSLQGGIRAVVHGLAEREPGSIVRRFSSRCYEPSRVGLRAIRPGDSAPTLCAATLAPLAGVDSFAPSGRRSRRCLCRLAEWWICDGLRAVSTFSRGRGQQQERDAVCRITSVSLATSRSCRFGGGASGSASKLACANELVPESSSATGPRLRLLRSSSTSTYRPSLLPLGPEHRRVLGNAWTPHHTRRTSSAKHYPSLRVRMSSLGVVHFLVYHDVVDPTVRWGTWSVTRTLQSLPASASWPFAEETLYPARAHVNHCRCPRPFFITQHHLDAFFVGRKSHQSRHASRADFPTRRCSSASMDPNGSALVCARVSVLGLELGWERYAVASAGRSPRHCSIPVGPTSMTLYTRTSQPRTCRSVAGHRLYPCR
uniref:Uncharacterized protein n=1 Tax=Mycena chlorophos TaxID=658473 RepID=A0ABQ0L9A6_MYCCL|nr:predicted protein [Mycena chlorophos]